MTAQTQGRSLFNFSELLLNTAVQIEAIKSGALNNFNHGNKPEDFQHVVTGVDSDGTTLVSAPLVQGVSNGALLLGVGFVLVVGGIVAAKVFD